MVAENSSRRAAGSNCVWLRCGCLVVCAICLALVDVVSVTVSRCANGQGRGQSKASEEHLDFCT